MKNKLLYQYRFEIGSATGLVMLCAVFSLLNSSFLSSNNLQNIIIQSSINAIIAVGMTLVIVSGGIDVSVGSIVALSGVVFGLTFRSGASTELAIISCMLVGIGCGIINGLLIASLRLPPFVTTLGMMGLARGIALVISDGRSISNFGAPLNWVVSSEILGIGIIVYAVFIIYILAHFVLLLTSFGKGIYAIGGNRTAAWLSGLNVTAITVAVYGICGFVCSLGALFLTARLDSAQPIAGVSYELDAIAATVIGGTSLSGGQGSVIGTLVGALIIGTIRNGLNLADVSPYMQQVAIGGLIILAVAIDRIIFKRELTT